MAALQRLQKYLIAHWSTAAFRKKKLRTNVDFKKGELKLGTRKALLTLLRNSPHCKGIDIQPETSDDKTLAFALQVHSPAVKYCRRAPRCTFTRLRVTKSCHRICCLGFSKRGMGPRGIPQRKTVKQGQVVEGDHQGACEFLLNVHCLVFVLVP